MNLPALKPTSGPWHVEKAIGLRILGPNDEPIAMPCCGPTVSAVPNAPLLAAAPELRDSLRDLLEWAGPYAANSSDTRVTVARELLARLPE